MKQVLTIFVLLCLLLSAFPARAAELDEEITGQIEAQLWDHDLSAWQEAAELLSKQELSPWSGRSVREWILSYASGEWAKGEGLTSFESLKGMLFSAVRGDLAILGAMIAAAVFTGIVSVLFEGDKGLRDILTLICCAMAVSLSAVYYFRIIGTAETTMRQLSGFAEKTTPVLSAMLAATGSLSSAGLLQPMLAFLCGSVMEYFTGLALPLLSAAGLLSIAGSLSGREELQRFSKLIRSFCKWSMGLIFTAFLGAVSLRGMSVSGADSIALRTAKYTLDKSIPIIGGAVSGTLDTVRGCAELIKNAAGAATMLTILAYVLEPAVQIAASSVILKVSAALCAPLSEGRLVKMLEELGDLCGFILAAVLACTMMFMILAGLCMAVGGWR